MVELLTISDFSWKESPWDVRAERILSSWRNTPYAPGQQARRIGVDCVQYVGAFLDEAFRSTVRTPIPRLKGDTSLHDPEKARAVIRLLRKAHNGSVAVEKGAALESGDVVVTRVEQQEGAPANEGHAMILGMAPWSAWHAIPGGVNRTALSKTRGIVAVYRPLGKDLWN